MTKQKPLTIADAPKAIKAAIGTAIVDDTDEAEKIDTVLKEHSARKEACRSSDRHWSGNVHRWSSVIDPLNK